MYWAIQLVLLVGKKTAYKPLCKQMWKIVTDTSNYPDAQTRATNISTAFLDAYKDNVFPPDVALYIIQRLGTAKEAIKERAQIVTKTSKLSKSEPAQAA